MTTATYSKETPCTKWVSSDDPVVYTHPCSRPGRLAVYTSWDGKQTFKMRCKRHHPEEIERRRIARGPTDSELREIVHRKLRDQAALVPVLVAALQATLDAFSAATWDHPDDEVGNAVIEQAKAALAKAKEASK